MLNNAIKTEIEKAAERLAMQKAELNSERFFYCENQCARISREQCARLFKKAEKFVERDYLNNSNNRPRWGLFGEGGLAHPGIKKCQGCKTGNENFEKAGK